MSIIYRLEAEKFKGSVISRVYFKGQAETSDWLENVTSVQRMSAGDTPQTCLSQTVYIRVGFFTRKSRNCYSAS